MKSRYVEPVVLVSAGWVLFFAGISKAATLTYTYDNLNRLTKVIYGDKATEQFTYDAAGKLVIEC